MEDTNKSFDYWCAEESPFKGNENNEDCKWASKFMQRAYEAGASSRQGEVDELNFQLAEMKSRLNEAYTDGQSSMYKTKQAEIDELNLKINRLIDSEESIARSCKGWRDAHRELDERIIKALSLIKDEVIEVDYDEYRFVGNFVDADKHKEILE